MRETKSCWKREEFRYGLLFTALWIFGFLAFSVHLPASSLYHSFTKFNTAAAPKWVSFKDFEGVSSDPLVWKSLLNTLFTSFILAPINPAATLLLVCIVTKNFRRKGAVRTAFFPPSAIPMVAATIVWIQMFNPTYGCIDNALGWFGINGPTWLLDAKYTKWILVLTGTRNADTIVLVCMAILQSVLKSYYESAETNGAGSVKRSSCITLPCVTRVFVCQTILSVINSFQYFQQVYTIVTANVGVKGGGTTGGPENSILIYPLYIFHNAFTYLKMGKVSAMAWILFIIVTILTIIMTKVTKRVTEDAGGEWL